MYTGIDIRFHLLLQKEWQEKLGQWLEEQEHKELQEEQEQHLEDQEHVQQLQQLQQHHQQDQDRMTTGNIDPEFFI